MIILQAQQVGRSFNGNELFANVNLEIQNGARIGLVGPNGIGKTTLLEILTGIAPPDAGQVTTMKNLSIGYLAQNSGLDSDKTIFKEMLTVFAPLQAMARQIHDLEVKLGDPQLIADKEAFAATMKQYDQLQHDFNEQNGYGYEAEIRSVLHGFQFGETTYDKPVGTLSGGERSRLALAKLLLEKHDLIILDEPTNHLDIETLSWLEGYLKTYPGAILTVSHDQYFLDHVVTEIYELDHHHATHYKTNYSGYLKQKADRQAQAWKAYNKQQEEIAKLQDFVDKNIFRASTTKQAQARRKQLEKMDVLEKPAGDNKTVHFNFTPTRPSGNEVLKVEQATVGYEPDKPMAGPIDFQVNKFDRIAIIGPNGVGKSTLLKSVLGKIPKPVSALSGGQKARLELTKLALKHDNFLVLDEPTNHLDINSKEVLEQALKDFSGTVLFVSHDRYFINELATNVVAIAPTGSTTYLGNWDYYQEKLTQRQKLRLLVQPLTSSPKKTPALNANFSGKWMI